MRVKVLDLIAGPAGIWHPGEHELPEALARRLCAVGAAISLEPAREETAELPGAPERADMSFKRKRRK